MCAALFGLAGFEVLAAVDASGELELLAQTNFNTAPTMRSRTAGIDNGRCSPVPGFGINTRRAGTGRHRASRKSAANSSRTPTA